MGARLKCCSMTLLVTPPIVPIGLTPLTVQLEMKKQK